jgi:hypothetical protein
MLTKDQILEVSDLKTETVAVPEWGGDVAVRSMTGADRDAFETAMITVGADGTRTPDMKNIRAKLVALTLVDGAGNRLFETSDIERLALKSAAALERIFDVAQRLNGMGAAAQADAVKN